MDIPPQELNPKWFKSHLLDRSVELQELYELPQGELDLLMAEAAELRTDLVNRDRNHGKWCTAGYFLELAKIISDRRSCNQLVVFRGANAPFFYAAIRQGRVSPAWKGTNATGSPEPSASSRRSGTLWGSRTRVIEPSLRGSP